VPLARPEAAHEVVEVGPLERFRFQREVHVRPQVVQPRRQAEKLGAAIQEDLGPSIPVLNDCSPLAKPAQAATRSAGRT
jgi:hypothetical protein